MKAKLLKDWLAQVPDDLEFGYMGTCEGDDCGRDFEEDTVVELRTKGDGYFCLASGANQVPYTEEEA